MYILVPIVLLLLPSDYFDNGKSYCLSVLILNKECYACGMTRAIMHLIHFDFQNAYYYNVLSFVVFPVLAFIWGTWFYKDYKLL